MTPPAPPRRPPGLRDRDIRETKTPPAGVLERSDAVPDVDFDDPKTNPHATDFEKMQSRIERGTKNTYATLTGISEVRKEFREDLQGANHRIDKMGDRIDVMGEHVGNLREGFGEMVGEQRLTTAAVRDLARAIEGQLAQHQKVTTTTLLSKVEVETEEKRDVIKARAWTREQMGKGIAWALGGGGLVAVITALASRC